MAQFTGSYSTYDAVGVREDLSDIIHMISPTETPFMSMIAGRGRARRTYPEWQIDSLASATTANAQIEGDDIVAYDASVPTTRPRNFTQISWKTLIITGTMEVVNKAGRKSEIAMQLSKRGKELKRDMETILLANQASVEGTDSAARVLGGLRAWLETNTQLGTGGADGGYSTGNGLVVVATDTTGGARALTESLLKAVIRDVWDEGGEPSTILVGKFNKQAISSFTGGTIAPTSTGANVPVIQRVDRSEDKKLVAAIDIYVSDFGTHRVVPDRFGRDRDVLVLTPNLWSVDYLRRFQQKQMARTGDAEKRLILAEYTLRSKNEAGSGLVGDCTVS
jgi:hypothetical protein